MSTVKMMEEERKVLQECLDNDEKDKSYNLKDFDGSVSLDELYEIRKVIYDNLDEYVSGSSIEGNGTNFNFTFNGKPFLLRVQVDKFHTELWKENKIGYWKEDES